MLLVREALELTGRVGALIELLAHGGDRQPGATVDPEFEESREM